MHGARPVLIRQTSFQGLPRLLFGRATAGQSLVPVGQVTGHGSGLDRFGPHANHTIRSTNSASAREMKPTYQNFCPRSLCPGVFLSWEDGIAGRRSRIHTLPGLGDDSPTFPVRRARPTHPARPRPIRVDVTLLSSMGNSSPPCVASSPCGVCIVARCSFCVGEERECRA